ncbi:MAG: DUF1877 family protein [Isosphaeraceae bacterium]
MSGQGYHLALDREQTDQLLSFDDGSDLLDWVSELFEGAWTGKDKTPIEGGHKDWNVLLGCLTNGTYDPKGGAYPLNLCFFGGRLLVQGGSIVNLVMPDDVGHVAEALAKIDKHDFRERYTRVPSDDLFHRETGAKDDEYQYELYAQMCKLKTFYQRAAQEGRAVIFYTDDPLDMFFKGEDLREHRTEIG